MRILILATNTNQDKKSMNPSTDDTAFQKTKRKRLDQVNNELEATATNGAYEVESTRSMQHQRSNKRPNKRHKPAKQQHVGNFRSYYTYRLGQQYQGKLEQDPRLSAIDHDWIKDKTVLDIGCNSGELTIALAKQFAPQSIVGIDIDAQLISQARRNIKDLFQKQKVESAFASIADKTESSTNGSDGKNAMPLSFQLWKAPPATASKDESKDTNKHSFPRNILFKREDITSDKHTVHDTYDVITCFSVTKWIHLFHGDTGIKSFFDKVFRLLSPGGRFLFEPQPWKSYHKRKFTSDVTAANYDQIQLRPKFFPEHLTTSVGFESCDLIQVCQTSAKGFKRPVYVAVKPLAKDKE